MAKLRDVNKKIGNVNFTFEIREVKIKNGSEKIGEVEVFAPKSLEALSEYIDLGHETEQHACKLYKSALAVELQAAARRSKTSGKMSVADYDKLYDNLTTEQKCQKSDAVRAAIVQIWQDEKATVEDGNTEDEDNE